MAAANLLEDRIVETTSGEGARSFPPAYDVTGMICCVVPVERAGRADVSKYPLSVLRYSC